jgi:hypothetical protein
VSTHQGSAADARVVRVCADSCAKASARRPKLPAAARSELGSPYHAAFLASGSALAPTSAFRTRVGASLHHLLYRTATCPQPQPSPRGRGEGAGLRTAAFARSFVTPNVRARTASQ